MKDKIIIPQLPEKIPSAQNKPPIEQLLMGVIYNHLLANEINSKPDIVPSTAGLENIGGYYWELSRELTILILNMLTDYQNET